MWWSWSSISDGAILGGPLEEIWRQEILPMWCTNLPNDLIFIYGHHKIADKHWVPIFSELKTWRMLAVVHCQFIMIYVLGLALAIYCRLVLLACRNDVRYTRVVAASFHWGAVMQQKWFSTKSLVHCSTASHFSKKQYQHYCRLCQNKRHGQKGNWPARSGAVKAPAACFWRGVGRQIWTLQSGNGCVVYYL